MNRREFVALVGVGGAMACAPEILGTATDQEIRKDARINGGETVFWVGVALIGEHFILNVL